MLPNKKEETKKEEVFFPSFSLSFALQNVRSKIKRRKIFLNLFVKNLKKEMVEFEFEILNEEGKERKKERKKD